jgi:hypothetical protein
MLDARFSYEGMLGASESRQLLEDLEAELTRRLQDANDPAKEALDAIHELRKLGHDLWSFDESDDFQIWCGDWVSPKHPYELIVTFSYRDDEPRSVSAVFQQRVGSRSDS